jgi:hypothetical protein
MTLAAAGHPGPNEVLSPLGAGGNELKRFVICDW